MNEEKRRFSPPAVGGSSLLVIFAVLCLTVFALLSLSTVQADKRLADSASKAVTGYYEADAKAEEILARLRRGEEPEGVTFSGSGLLFASYACPISETQALFVDVCFYSQLDDNYTILRWQAKSTANWQPDESMNVWDGN